MTEERYDQNHAGARRLMLCRILVLAWFAATIVASLFPQSPSGGAAAGIQFLALLGFVLVHASLAGGWRGASAFVAILGVASFVLEAISIATGVPFGFFHHNTAGPRLLDVPMAVPIGYAVFGWPAWAQTMTLMRSLGATGRTTLLGAPVIGTFLLAGYDYPWDPIGATVLKVHGFRDPSGLFGVPLSNFLGWLVTGWVAFQLLALVQRRFVRTLAAETMTFALLPSIIWIGTALSYFLQYAVAPPGATSVGGRTFVIADIYEASAAISLPAMILPAIVTIIAAMVWHDRSRDGGRT